jgi:translation initiation factor 1A
MPKNKGGKGFKKQKNEVFDDKHMIFKEEGQYYGLVTKMLGSGRVECYCYSDRGGALSSTKHIGIIRGAMRKKKIWVSVEDIVLISKRDYQEGKVDIIHRYKHEEALQLISMKVIPSTGITELEEEDNVVSFENEIGGEFNYDDDVEDDVEGGVEIKVI